LDPDILDPYRSVFEDNEELTTIEDNNLDCGRSKERITKGLQLYRRL